METEDAGETPRLSSLEVKLKSKDFNYLIHQFKNEVTDNENGGKCVFQTTKTGTVYLQAYNRVSEEWDTVNTTTTQANTDTTIEGYLEDPTDYKDVNNFISFRVYQDA